MADKIPEKLLQDYLSKKYDKKVKILNYNKLGSGWHGEGYKIEFMIGQKKDSLIIRVQKPLQFSHDYKSDRAASFIQQHEHSKNINKHIRSIDVIGISDSKITSLGDTNEFYQLVETATGEEYFKDLDRILKTNKLKASDRKKAILLSDYLVELHKNKFKGTKDKKRSLNLRHTRDCIGHGEMLLGVIDTYPENKDKEILTEILLQAVKFREKIKDKKITLCTVHGDFHPGNIIFSDINNFKVLDASREEYGNPADDISSILINYIWYAVKQKGKFEGIFKELFDLFYNNYLKKIKDKTILDTIQLFFAFRAVVVAQPIFYSDQKEDTRKKMLNFAKNVLKSDTFDTEKINQYLFDTKAIWITGLPGSGKSTIARELSKRLKNYKWLRLDEIRKKYIKNPRYTDKERDHVYKKFVEEGIALVNSRHNIIFDATAHKIRYRNHAREKINKFTEVYVKCPIDVCIERESKRKQGLIMAEMYKKAFERKKTGKNIKGLGKVIGIDVMYEENKNAEIVIQSDKMNAKEAADKIMEYID